MCASHSVMSNSATLWTVARQAPLSMGFSRQEYWPFPTPGDLPNPGTGPGSPALQADSLPFEPPGKLHTKYTCIFFFKFTLTCWVSGISVVSYKPLERKQQELLTGNSAEGTNSSGRRAPLPRKGPPQRTEGDPRHSGGL